MLDEMYQCSPYLILDLSSMEKLKTKNSVIYNTLNDKTFHLNPEIFSTLKSSIVPRSKNTIVNESDEIVFEWLKTNLFLLETKNMWSYNDFTSVDIEINTCCNWRCEYCPTKNDPKHPETMSMDLFNEIIDKIEIYGGIEDVTLNGFNEPTLDKYFIDRVEKLKSTNIKLALHTNGSYLSKEISKYLKESEIAGVTFNLPSVNPEKIRLLTGWKDFDHVIQNIQDAIDVGLHVSLSIQGTSEEIEINIPQIKEKFQSLLNEPIKEWGTTDRAGLLNNRYCQKVNIVDDKLYGCLDPLRALRISVKGDIFICSHDYYQKTVLGNICDGQIVEIFSSQKAINMIKKVFGALKAEDSFICRKCKRMEMSGILHRVSKSIKPVF